MPLRICSLIRCIATCCAENEEESSSVADTSEVTKVREDETVGGTGTGTELLLKTPEKDENTDEIGTRFLLGDMDQEGSTAKETTVGRRRKSRVDEETGPGREMKDITADALSIQPTGYTLETAHVGHMFVSCGVVASGIM